jgi:hypothetical protein
MSRTSRRLFVLLLAILVSVATDLWGQRGGGHTASRGSARTSVNHDRNANVNQNRNTNVNQNRNVNVNQNVNVNRDVNVNVDRDVDVHVHGGYGYYDNDCCFHPVAAVAAVAVTAAVIGSIVNSIPPSCTAVAVNGFTYQQCGSTWYQPQFVGSTTSYVVVAAPR